MFLNVSLHLFLQVKMAMEGAATKIVPYKNQETSLKYFPKRTILLSRVSLKAELIIYAAQYKLKVKIIQ